MLHHTLSLLLSGSLFDLCSRGMFGYHRLLDVQEIVGPDSFIKKKYKKTKQKTRNLVKEKMMCFRKKGCLISSMNYLGSSAYGKTLGILTHLVLSLQSHHAPTCYGNGHHHHSSSLVAISPGKPWRLSFW